MADYFDQFENQSSSESSFNNSPFELPSSVRFLLHDVVEQGDNEELKRLLTPREVTKDMEEAEKCKDQEDEEREDQEAEDLSTLYLQLLNTTDSFSNTPLHIAIMKGNIDCLKTLVDSGANLEKFCQGMPSIHLSIRLSVFPQLKESLIEIVQYLAPIVNLAECDSQNQSVLHAIGETGFTEILMYIWEKVDPGILELKDNLGFTALHCAVQSRNTNCVNAFLDLGSDVNAITNLQETPLTLSVLCGSHEITDLLVKSGANLALLNWRNLTAFDIAQRRSDFVTMQILEQNYSKSLVFTDCHTIVITDDAYYEHKTCSSVTRHSKDIVPENVLRMHALVGEFGVLKSEYFSRVNSVGVATPVEMGDILRVHEYHYIRRLLNIIKSLNTDPEESLYRLDPDTTISKGSWEAALRAAGAPCNAVDQVMSGKSKNAFCAVRPPGHHAGPTGVVKAEDYPHGSNGFCLLNNVGIAAAYVASVYRQKGIKKIAIIDFDVHHGNGTESIVRNVVPSRQSIPITTHLVDASFNLWSYKPWVGVDDSENIFFCSTHGFGSDALEGIESSGQALRFYPGSGRTTQPNENGRVEKTPGEPWIINVGLGKGEEGRDEFLHVYRTRIFPALLEFDPDFIFVSSGFDAHAHDGLNHGFVSLMEQDYAWITSCLVKIANKCCEGRLVSILEGGYNVDAGFLSPFARSVASHVRVLMNEKESWVDKDNEIEIEMVKEIIREREEKKKQMEQKIAQLYGRLEDPENGLEQSDQNSTSRRSKRQRGPALDYAALNAELEEELQAKRIAREKENQNETQHF